LDGNTGDPIVAAADGVVLSAGWRTGYGNTVVISHGGGYTTLYAHQTDINVSNGQTVAGGELIGWVGSTGWSTGAHLHFEVRVNGAAVDPLAFYPF
ncbi:MAG: M23 family metallopeptidase, partial [Actinomycetota bacterium]